MSTQMKFETNENNVIGKLLDKKAQKNQDKPFIFFEDGVVSYKGLQEKVNKVANGFLRMGIKKEDKVALIMENCPEYIYTWFALARIGAIEVPVNTFHKGDVLEYLLNYSDAEVLVISDTVIPNIKAIENNINSVKNVIIHGSAQERADLRIPTKNYESLYDNPSTIEDIEVHHNDLMAIMFTSGTTGRSKGVMITHNQAIFIGSQYVDFLDSKTEGRGYIYIPLFHMAGQFAGILAPMYADSSLVLKTGFSAEVFWDDIRKYNCTVSGMFEAVVQILYKAPEKNNDADNPLRICGTAHIPQEIQEPFEKRFNVKLVNIFGMTEGDCQVSSTHDDIKVGSFGKPRGYFQAVILDSFDRELPPNKVGELAFRPLQPHIMFEGYYKMPEKTLETFRNLWWHTGDLAYKDDEGYFFFIGREKDMIRRGGENISAMEIEEIIMSHPAVKLCAAVAVKSEIWGEEVKIVVITKEDMEVKPEELVDYSDERMAYFMIPRYIEFVKEMPVTGASQRPVKRELNRITPTTWDRVKAGVKIKREKGKK